MNFAARYRKQLITALPDYLQAHLFVLKFRANRMKVSKVARPLHG